MKLFKIENAEETIRFIKIFDKAFDCLNVRSRLADKPERRGYKSLDDERLEVSKLNTFYRR